ncbi:MAG: type I methionyl aminopeptidase [Chlorobi bacterium]|nr:type I methionyl aminopeptidase [Chlorobiota bacterium]
MIVLKTDEEIAVLRENNLLVSRTLAEVGKEIKPGVTTRFLDQIAEQFILDHGAKPGFKGYNGFPNTLCTSVNSQVVHGIPSDYQLKEGDIISVDCGVLKDGFYGDSAFTFAVGNIEKDTRKLLHVTRECLELGVKQIRPGNRVGDIGSAVQYHAESNGFSVVRELVGHGLGRNLHEAPEVPNYGKRGKGPKLKAGLVVCVEPMINMGKKDIYQKSDGWTIQTVDGKPSAHFEYAVVVRIEGAEVLTTFKYIDEIIKPI